MFRLGWSVICRVVSNRADAEIIETICDDLMNDKLTDRLLRQVGMYLYKLNNFITNRYVSCKTQVIVNHKKN